LLFGCSKSRIRKIIGQKTGRYFTGRIRVIDEVYPKFDRQDLDGKLQPFFGSALNNFGVKNC
jgi:peptide subunit release factor RF-3